MDEILRQKFESYHSELDPTILSQVLEEVEKGDRANGLILALSSFLIVILVMLGSNFSSRDLMSQNTELIPSKDLAMGEGASSSEILSSDPKSSIGAVTSIDSDRSSDTEDVLVKKKEEAFDALPEVGYGSVDKSGGADVSKTMKPEIVNQIQDAPSMVVIVPEVVTARYAILENSDAVHLLVAIPSRSWNVGRHVDVKNERGIKTSPTFSFDPSAVNSVRRKWSAEFLIGPSLNYRTFDASESPEFTAHKNESDKSLLSANSEFLIHYQPNVRWIFSLGVGKMNTGENYAFTLNEQTHEFKNEYHYLTIPVRTKFRIWDISTGIDLYTGLGAQIGLLQEGTSSWVDLNTERAVTHSNKGSDSPFSEQVISGEADIMIRVALSKRLFVSAQERGTYAFNSIYKNETGLDQHQFSFDSLLGIGIRF